MKVVVVYDDTVAVNNRIKTIIGKRPYGKIVLKRQSLFGRVKRIVNSTKAQLVIKYIDAEKQFNDVQFEDKNAIYFHLFSNAAVLSEDGFRNILEKIQFVDETMVVSGDNDAICGAVFCGRNDYEEFLKEYSLRKDVGFLKDVSKIRSNNVFVDISDYTTLLMFISSGFDARFFNSLVGDEYSVTKRSKDKKKMKAEYKYFWLLPERMRSFMVMPYDYKEDENGAQYTMERMPMTDIAIRWTHGAVDLDELDKILDKTFHFFSIREAKKISREEYFKAADKLYLDKVKQRTEDLKKLDEFKAIESMIASGTDYGTIDDIMDDYYALYEKIFRKAFKGNSYKSVIGHGDVFFANMLYSKEANLLRLIDPKGATEESQLWNDPYYDIVKLSHSVCGNYDFFNTGFYDIELEKDMHFNLKIFTDNTKAKELFRQYLEKNGYNYRIVRLCEASLFLSMLPLHIDNPHKVFGFILNAINILKEVKNEI